MRLRIISGRLGGRFIEAPRGRTVRPTAERAREAWFSALGSDVTDAAVVDLFAGSGALGIEALSRGARHVHFVESNRAVARTIRANLEMLELTSFATVVTRDVFSWLAGRPGWWDVALADPPYAGGVATRLVAAFRDSAFATCLWVEHSGRESEIAETAEWTRRYGDSQISRFRSEEERTNED